MTEQSETERVINALINLNRRLIAEQGKSRDVFQEHKDQIEIDAINYSIFALKSQSEAERKIEKVREYCKNDMCVEDVDLDDHDSGYRSCWNENREKILEILEEKPC